MYHQVITQNRRRCTWCQLMYGYDVCISMMAAWLSSNGVARINEVTVRLARLVLGWVTVREFESRSRRLGI